MGHSTSEGVRHTMAARGTEGAAVGGSCNALLPACPLFSLLCCMGCEPSLASAQMSCRRCIERHTSHHTPTHLSCAFTPGLSKWYALLAYLRDLVVQRIAAHHLLRCAGGSSRCSHRVGGGGSSAGDTTTCNDSPCQTTTPD